MSLGDRSRLGDRPPRHHLEAVVRLRCPGRTRVHTGFLKNLSHAGMFLRILDPEMSGTRIGFDVFFTAEDGSRSTLSGEGEVAWSRDEYEGPGLPPGMGVRFLSLGSGGAEVLSRVLGTSQPEPEGPSFESALSGTTRDAASDQGLDSAYDAPTLILDPTSKLAPGAGFQVGASVEPAPYERSVEEHERLGDDDSFNEFSSRFSGPVLRWLVPCLLFLGVSVGGYFAWQQWTASHLADSPASDTADRPTGEDRHRGSEGDELVTLDTVAPPGASPDEPGNLERPSPVDVADPSLRPDGAAQTLPSVRHITDVRSEVGESLTMVLLVGDGTFASDQLDYSYIGGESPRVVLRVRDVERSGDRVNETMEEGFIRAIRTGYHTGTDGELGSLHVVLDLTGPEIKVQQVLPSGSEFLIYLGPE